MPVRIQCPNPDCGKTYSVADDQLGQTAVCKHCGHTFTLKARKSDTLYSLAQDTTGPGASDANSAWREVYYGRNVFSLSALGATHWRLSLLLRSTNTAGSPKIRRVKITPR